MPPALMIASTLNTGREAPAAAGWAGGKDPCDLLLGLAFVPVARFCGLEEVVDGLLSFGSAAFGSFFTKQRGSSCSGGEAGGQGRGR